MWGRYCRTDRFSCQGETVVYQKIRPAVFLGRTLTVTVTPFCRDIPSTTEVEELLMRSLMHGCAFTQADSRVLPITWWV